MNRIDRKWIGVAIAALAVGALGVARAQTSVPQSLVYAVYDSPNGAADAFKAMKETQKKGVIHIDSYAVVSKDDKGKVHVHSTQKKGARAGAVVGALVGAIGGPAGAAVGAAAGGGIGYLTGNAVGIPKQDIDTIKTSLQPGTSALIAVTDEMWVADLEQSLREAQAKQVLDRKLAQPSGQENTPPATPPATP
jgi:uncharacterized membrane protein